MIRKIGIIVLIAISLAFACKGWHTMKQGFSISRIETHAHTSQLQTAPLNSISDQALSQNYYFLGKGHQCYAFSSEDGEYVLKFPRSDRYRLSFWLKSFPFFQRKKIKALKDKIQRHKFITESFHLANNELRKETALLMLHLNPTKNIQKSVKIHDRLGQPYEINLDQTPFILQKKGTLLMPLIESAIKHNRKEKSQEMLHAFLDCVAFRAQKGIFNKDASFLRNFAFSESKVVQIDVGSFYYPKQSRPAKHSFTDTIEPVKEWLWTIDSETAAWFETEASKRSDTL
jgi:hypothetical protein